MTNVLGLTLYGPLAASTRYRLLQYIPGLNTQDIQLQVNSLLNDVYLTRRFLLVRRCFCFGTQNVLAW
jgi:hypothetical protein